MIGVPFLVGTPDHPCTSPILSNFPSVDEREDLIAPNTSTPTIQG